MILLMTDVTGDQSPRTDRPMFLVWRAAVQNRPDWPGYGSLEAEPDWAVEQIRWASGGQVSSMRLRRILGLGPGRTSQSRPERCEPSFGDRFVLRDEDGQEWFRGVASRVDVEVSADPDRQELIVEIDGPERLLDQSVISGQWHRTIQAEQAEIDHVMTQAGRIESAIFRSDLPVVFNQGGRPNASEQLWRLAAEAETPGCCVFEYPDRPASAQLPATWWTAGRALRSCVEIIDGYRVISPETDWLSIESALDAAVLDELDLESMTLLEAIAAICEQADFAFAVEPWASDGQGRHRLVACSRQYGSLPVMPLLADGPVDAASPAGRAAEIRRIHVSRSASQVRNHVEVIGDLHRVEAALEFWPDPSQRTLHPAWDLNDPKLSNYSSWTYETIFPGNFSTSQWETFVSRYHKDGALWPAYRHALRSFCWNEDGALTGSLGLPTGQAEQVADVLAGPDGQHVVRPRPMGPRLAYGLEGIELSSLPAQIELFIVGCPEATVSVPAKIWTNRCGFTLDVEAFFEIGPDGNVRQWQPFASLPDQPYTVNGSEMSEQIRSAAYLNLLHNSLDQSGDLQIGLRFSGTLAADTAVGGTATRRDEHPWPFPAQRVLRKPLRFARLWPRLADADYEPAMAVDQTAEAETMARQFRQRGESLLGRCRIDLRRLTRAYRPGQTIAQTDGRIVRTSPDDPQGRPLRIIAVRWDLREETFQTSLELA